MANGQVELQLVPVTEIDPSPYQVRKHFDEQALAELANSITRDGLIEPIVIRRISQRYQLIAGERRLRATRMSNGEKILSRIVDVTDLQARRMAAAENVQRADLSPIEWIDAVVEIVDAELIEEEGYLELGQTNIDRVKTLLVKLDSDRKNDTDYFSSKFTAKTDDVFTRLPKPMEWISFLTNDLPLITTIDAEVKSVAIQHKLNKSKTKSLAKLKKEAPKKFKEIIEQGGVSAKTDLLDFSSDEPIVPLTDLSAREIDHITTQARIDQARVEFEPIETPSLPNQRYRCIVIDPPWPMDKIEREERPDQGNHLEYPTMEVFCTRWNEDDQEKSIDFGDEYEHIPCWKLVDYGEDIPLCQSIECILGSMLETSIEKLGCHIYLWTTHRFLPDALQLFANLDIKYQCLMTWVKNVGITPFSWMYDTEHVLFGRLGSLPLQQNGLRLSFTAPVEGHSIKPEIFYERVRHASPEPRLDMFNRRHIEGFDGWGKESITQRDE